MVLYSSVLYRNIDLLYILIYTVYYTFVLLPHQI